MARGRTGAVGRWPRGRGSRAGYPEREGAPGIGASRRRSLTRRLLRQTLAAGVLFLLVLAIHSLPFPAARRAEDGVRWLLNLQVDVSPLVSTLQRLWGRLPGQVTAPGTSGEAGGQAQGAASPALGSQPPAAAGPEGAGGGPRPGTLQWPVPGPVTSPFGWREPAGGGDQELHEGLDLGAAPGSEVFAAADGTVVQVRRDSTYGLVVELDHGGGVTTLYAHNSQVLAALGERVRRGQTIALVGRTGRAEGDHLHFEVRSGGVPVDPVPWLEPRAGGS
ncbi:MAG: M23 family metallopeptidase [Acetobacteraceae bacterium]|nr:M23 family metallopeptidase [Acetobacteraceae bacterium]